MVIDKLAAGLKVWLLGHLLERADNQNNTYCNVFPSWQVPQLFP
jgi:hypothetical protein